MRPTEQLRNKNWLVFFRDGYVVAHPKYHVVMTTALRMPLENGGWENRAHSTANWERFRLNPTHKLEIEALRSTCYCAQLTDATCDYCNGLRRLALTKFMGGYSGVMATWRPIIRSGDGIVAVRRITGVVSDLLPGSKGQCVGVQSWSSKYTVEFPQWYGTVTRRSAT